MTQKDVQDIVTVMERLLFTAVQARFANGGQDCELLPAGGKRLATTGAVRRPQSAEQSVNQLLTLES